MLYLISGLHGAFIGTHENGGTNEVIGEGFRSMEEADGQIKASIG